MNAAPTRAPATVPRTNRFPSLDGLRAISILLVLLGHLSGTRLLGRLYFGVGDIAHLGVVVFFVISGFLITSLLMAEHKARGRISLKLFYARRALRIFPASYAFIGCMSLLWAAGLIQLHAGDIWHAITYTVNYSVSRSWYVGHLWSLSVEEQFYLLWPLAFAVLGPRRAIWVAVGVILFGPVARMFAVVVLRGTPYRDLEMFPMVADSLAAGCLLARMRNWLETQRWYMRLFSAPWVLAMVAVLLTLNRLEVYGIGAIFGTAAINLLIAVLIHRSVCRWDGWTGRILNSPPVAFCGTLSYSLYLWQQPFLNRNSSAWGTAFPQNLLFACGAALLSYLLLEKPLMTLRHRLRG